MRIEVGNVVCRVTGDAAAHNILWDVLSYKDPGFMFSPAYRAGRWDAYHRLYMPPSPARDFGKMWTGTLYRAVSALQDRGYTVEVVDQRKVPSFTLKISTGGGNRAYQVDAVAAAIAATRGVIRAPTASGKTKIASSLFQILPLSGVFIVHKLTLLHQAMDTFKEVLKEDIGIIQGDNRRIRRVNVATIQSLANVLYHPNDEKIRQYLIDENSIIICDECFVAGTLVDGKPIERIKVGDTVSAWDEKDKALKIQPVTKVFKSKAPKFLYKITTDRGSVVCTSNHPFLAHTEEWVRADNLNPGDYIYAMTNLWKNDRPQTQSVSNVLQIRHCKPMAENWNRSRRAVSSCSREKSTRQEERGFLALSRVDNIEVLEQGSNGEFELLCPDGYVYNLEVKNSHTYTANGLIVHNCHHAKADQFKAVLQQMISSYFRWGLSATPRKHEDPQGKTEDLWVEALFGREIYNIGREKLTMEKFLAKAHIFYV